MIIKTLQIIITIGNSRGVYLGDPALEEVMAELDRRAALVFVHPAALPGAPMAGPGPALVDFTLDTTRAAVNLVLHGVTRRHPHIRFVLSHAGGSLPYVAWRVATLRAEFVDTGDDPQGYAGGPVQPDEILAELRRFYFDTALSASPTALPSVLEFAGADHVVFGSDWPYAGPAVLDTFVPAHDALLTDDATRLAVNRGTAAGLIPRLGATR